MTSTSFPKRQQAENDLRRTSAIVALGVGFCLLLIGIGLLLDAFQQPAGSPNVQFSLYLIGISIAVIGVNSWLLIKHSIGAEQPYQPARMVHLIDCQKTYARSITEMPDAIPVQVLGCKSDEHGLLIALADERGHWQWITYQGAYLVQWVDEVAS